MNSLWSGRAAPSADATWTLAGVLALGVVLLGIGWLKSRRTVLRQRRFLAIFESERSLIRALDDRLQEQIEERSQHIAEQNAVLQQSLEALRSAQRQLVLSEKMASLGLLSAGVAHEINNPLAFMMANFTYVRETLGLGGGDGTRKFELRALSAPELRDLNAALEEGLEGGRRIASIVSDLKMFSRSDASPLGPVDIRDAMTSALRMTHLQLHQRARLVKELAEVPHVQADPGKLSQVFLNLLVNACQAIPEGNPLENEIRVKLFENPAGVVAEVQDTGSGISADVQRHLFEPFFTTKPVGQGTGLGLSVSQGIIQSFGGKIEVESAPGQGSTFRIILPRAQSVAGGRA